MFFLRCAFFLSLVYSSMSWTNVGPQGHAASGLAAQGSGVHVAETGRAVVNEAVAGATDLCARHAAECLADAARLTSLFAATEPSAPAAAAASAVERDPVPLRAPHPRHRPRDGKLARAS